MNPGERFCFPSFSLFPTPLSFMYQNLFFLVIFLYTSFIFLFPISSFFHFVSVIDLFFVCEGCVLPLDGHGKTNQGNCIFLFGLQEDPGERGNDFNIKLDNCIVSLYNSELGDCIQLGEIYY